MIGCDIKINVINIKTTPNTPIMKNKFFYGMLIMLSLTLMSFTCSDNDSMNDDNTAEIKQIKSNVISGTWKITSFIDSGNDETNHYTGYSFTFNSNGVLTATNANTVVTGTWSITDSNSNDDDSNSNDIDFNIFFSSPATFNDDLTEDWDIVNHNTTKIQLVHISGGNGGTDILIFEKI